MCGFVGFVNKKKKNKKIIKEMSAKIIHRGPDSEGYYLDEEINMAFRRLSIIDLKNGDQPIYNEKKDLVILFNGEIYNFEELREELIKKGHIFKTNTDTEVIIHGYEEYKEEILKKLRGMYAICIWDPKEKELFLARDIFGIKPLYYAFMNDTFFFGSEIKGFLPHPDFEKVLNEKNLKTYLTFQYNPNEETFFKGVYKLLPGHYLKYKEGKIETKSYFEFQFHPKKRNEQAMIKELNDLIASSINYHKISDVEVGSFLSAGIDSSYITSILRPDKTFTVGFDFKGFDETIYAKNLCQILELKNKSHMISKKEFMATIPKVQYYSDEPHANLSSVPLYILSGLAKKDVTVVLSGEGADELFGGYQLYYENPLMLTYRHLPKSLRKFNSKVLGKLPNRHLKNFFSKGALDVEDFYIGQAEIFSDEQANNILNHKYQTTIKATDITKPYYDKVQGCDEITKKQYLDMFLWLPNDILLKADKMTMANSLELRVPYLDKEVLKFAETIPKNLRYHGKVSKYILRKAATKAIPEEWFNREKLGFLVPFKEYLKDEDVYQKVKKEFTSSYAKEFFDSNKIMKLLDEHYEGKASNHRKVYTIYTFLLWYKEYFLN